MRTKLLQTITLSAMILLFALMAYSVFSERSLSKQTDEVDQRVIETMEELRSKRDAIVNPIKEEIVKKQDYFKQEEDKWNKKIDELKPLLSTKYRSQVEILCSEGSSDCEQLRRNITVSSSSSIEAVLPKVEAANTVENSPHNFDDYTKLDKYFKSKYSPLNGYGYSFTKYAKQYGVDADLAVCITWADSSAGKNMTTTNNPGNVGNNDGGKRVGYKTMEAGIEAIFRVLNNRYLSSNNTLGELSNGGRVALGLPTSSAKNVFVYATSLTNWNRRTKECMGVLKGTPIDEMYKFRANK